MKYGHSIIIVRNNCVVKIGYCDSPRWNIAYKCFSSNTSYYRFGSIFIVYFVFCFSMFL